MFFVFRLSTVFSLHVFMFDHVCGSLLLWFVIVLFCSSVFLSWFVAFQNFVSSYRILKVLLVSPQHLQVL